MIKIKVPATSANLGVGFDTLGIALNIYNTYYVEKSDSLIIEGVDKKYQNRDNLFVVAFDKVCERLNTSMNIHLKIENDSIIFFDIYKKNSGFFQYLQMKYP